MSEKARKPSRSQMALPIATNTPTSPSKELIEALAELLLQAARGAPTREVADEQDRS